MNDLSIVLPLLVEARASAGARRVRGARSARPHTRPAADRPSSPSFCVQRQNSPQLGCESANKKLVAGTTAAGILDPVLEANLKHYITQGVLSSLLPSSELAQQPGGAEVTGFAPS
ncbi:hypothetical protein FQA47_010754 [Oryzias melastigma]|uniref:Uncharacterized protein n=1 Tax=Oryzias melastigma TaxID=30732 RepID=A0A834C739_ORYME|nr:hypothetical protein FQA47_010754 [Oryzias melastigma]